jgi:ABC-type amino acid transport substrate-binding protein
MPMTTARRRTRATASFLLTAALLAGCAAPAAASSTSAGAATHAGTDTLSRIGRTGTITLGFREDARPFSYRGPDGQPAGYSVELCKRAVESLRSQLKVERLEARWVPVTVATRIPAVVEGTVDLECGTTTRTLGRMEQVDFSVPTFIEGASFVSRAGTGLRTGRDLAGRKVGVIPGTTTATMLEAARAQAGFNGQLVTVQTHDEGLAAVRDGRIDAYMTDRAILVGLAGAAGGAQAWTMADDYFSLETYGLMMRRDPAFRLAVNRALANLYRSGAVNAVFKTAFGPNARPTGMLENMFLLNALPE